METKERMQRIAMLCGNLPEGHEDLAREVLSGVTGRWSLWVLYVLAHANEPVRFSRVLEAVEGITQKVLTQTLRQLERNGFVSRKVYPQVPPRVEYALTPLGAEFLAQAEGLWTWMLGQSDAFAQARRRFDEV